MTSIFSNKELLQHFIEKNIPLWVKPTKGKISNTTYVAVFKSNNALNTVIESLTNKFWEKIVSEPKLTNSFSFEIDKAICNGTFDIQQNSDGSLYIVMANFKTVLNINQINDLNIPYNNLKNFNKSTFDKYYNL